MKRKNIFKYLLEDKDFDILNNLKRWNGERVIKDETVSHHSFIVTFYSRIIAHMLVNGRLEEDLYDKFIKHVMDDALFHDYDEYIDRDLNHNLKHNMYNGAHIRDAVEEYKKVMLKTKYETLESEEGTPISRLKKFLFNKITRKKTQYDMGDVVTRIIKLSDWLASVSYLQKELLLGNSGITKEFNHVIASVVKLAGEFIEEFKPRYDFDYTVIQQIIQMNLEDYD